MRRSPPIAILRAYSGWTGGERDLLTCTVMGNPIADQSPTGRCTVSEAAGVLGISVEAARERQRAATRGTF